MTDTVSPGSTPAAKVNRLAAASLTLGILGWVLYLLQWCLDLSLGWLLAILSAGASAVCSSFLDILPFPFWLIGLVLGHVALGQIKRTGGGGRGKAIGGLVLAYSGLSFGFLLLLLFAGLIAIGVQSPFVQTLIPSSH